MATQRSLLNVVNGGPLPGPDFGATLLNHQLGSLRRSAVTTLQINVGKLCNQACHHCHVEAGPKRTEIMSTEVANRILDLLTASPSIRTVDITGGAPELNSNFRRFVESSRAMGRHVIDRCNLTVFFEPGQEGLPEFLGANQVEIAASLPCYTTENVDQQRGKGVFDKSIQALQLLNRMGYGRAGSGLVLNLVYNPLGASLPPPQEKLEADYKKQLQERFGIEFNRLFTITNMPIKRFAEYLLRNEQLESYVGLLVDHFNPATVNELMCRSLVSVGWDGKLYDCDFNQMLDLETPGRKNIWEIDSFSRMAHSEIATGGHCFGCTAGTGSSCGGSLR
ncbi:MAG TPA: arsenosugar biosynthesis radical SAM (seleno)protein ArsS [Candidatus Saccharimonadales bacterium]|jgi:radical SAM/Cys-rich protein|nr:arsenosugar biosynthesis radical SAM (seleno)protein ArsS [Candidatus Saccharimonadales bacterium]